MKFSNQSTTFFLPWCVKYSRPLSLLEVMEFLVIVCTNSIHHFHPWWFQQSPLLGMGQDNFYPLLLSTTFFDAIASSLSYDASWRGSSSFCVWSFHKRSQRPEHSEATTQMLLRLHPAFPHPNPMDICMNWIVEFSPDQPCLHGSWDDECWAYKPFPAEWQFRI